MQDIEKVWTLLWLLFNHFFNQGYHIWRHIICQAWMDHLLIDNALVNFAQLLQANIILAEHVEKHDSKGVYIRLETVDTFLTPRGVLLRRSEPQSSHTRRQFAKDCGFLIHFSLDLGWVLLYL